MITLAWDTATARCTVAATDGTVVVRRLVDGARQHSRELHGLMAEVLRELGAGPRDVSTICTGDGPGGFTGLRLAAAAAKGLIWGREGDVRWHVAPSLLLRAAAASHGDDRVLALADALRGEVFAGIWQFGSGRVSAHGPGNAAVDPARLAELGPFDRIVGTITPVQFDMVAAATGIIPVIGDDALPDAAVFFELLRLDGGTVAVDSPADWEPVYGRPAEAQVVWERKHGRALPGSAGSRG